MAKRAQTKSNPDHLSISAAEVAFEKTAKARAALAPEAILQVNLDIPMTVATVLAMIPDIESLHSEIAHYLPRHDMDKVEHLRTYAEALMWAHNLYLSTSQRPDVLPALAARATEM